MNILHENIAEYLLSLHESQFSNPVLKEMEDLAKEKKFPIIGPIVGNLLSICAKMVQARKILELGSGYGYSAFWFALAIGKNGEILCTDGEEKNKELAFHFFQKGKIETKIEYRIGDALTIAKNLKEKFDLIFCDIDKQEYHLVIDLANDLLDTGGLLIFDNALWSGKVLDESANDEATQGVKLLNQTIFSDTRFQSTIVPIRDGVLIARKN
ncbi:MAG: O-methyltransferase [bacterium]|nr:O-methyltransferase [bacterium]